MIGILGGGQLSVFLIEAAHRLGKKTRVLLTDPSEPAAHVSDEVVRDTGGKNSEFFAGLELLLFESENIDLTRLEGAISPETKVVPSLSAMTILQDKGEQKKLLDRLSLPTSRFLFLSPDFSNVAPLDAALPKGWILKRARGGYDGKGNWLGSDREEALSWARIALAEKVAVYAEERVKIARELAMVITRTAEGQISSFPAVITSQANGVCDFVEGPARTCGLSKEAEDRLFEITRKIADAVAFVGTMAVEFFETASGEFLVNEIAPRVHNSGHFTIEAARTSQFEQHLRAALGMPLGSTETAAHFWMKNCLGPSDIALDRKGAFPHAENWGKVVYHDYGKAKVRPGRKLGHLTIWGSVEDRAEHEKETAQAHERWVNSLQESK